MTSVSISLCVCADKSALDLYNEGNRAQKGVNTVEKTISENLTRCVAWKEEVQRIAVLKQPYL